MNVVLISLLLFSFLHSHFASEEADCYRPADSGLCLAHFERYFYHPKFGKCQKFVYGGCGGNGNNFETEEECCKACGDDRCLKK